MLERLHALLLRRMNKLMGQLGDTGNGTADTTGGAAFPFPLVDVAELYEQGLALLAENQPEAAEARFREGLQHASQDVPLLIGLGRALKAQGRLSEARVPLRRVAVGVAPEVFEALFLLGEISEQQGDGDDAKRQYFATLKHNPRHFPACENIARLMVQTGEESQVLPFLQARVQECPDSKELRLLLAHLFLNRGAFEGALEQLTTVVQQGFDDAPIYMVLASTLCSLGREPEAAPYFERALALDESVAYQVNLQRGLFHLHHSDTGSGVQRGIEFLEKAIELQPLNGTGYSALLLAMTHSAKTMQRSYRDMAERFGEAFAYFKPALEPILKPLTTPQGTRPLRVGFVAGEFRNHPVWFFLGEILTQFDKTRIHTTAFSNNRFNDALTFEFQKRFDAWNDIVNLDDEAVCNLVKNQQIDVLIDLAGHSGDRRLSVFAAKPAPVQVEWLGYFASTGLQTMDYILADRYCVPENGSEWFSEKVFYMPATRLCMGIPRPARPIAVAPPPCVAKGYVTFASFQQIIKLQPPVLQTWAKILAAMPTARLLLQTSALHVQAEREKLAARLTAAGIDLARVDMRGHMHWEDYLESHAEVDICLDTFPYTGGTTTAFALWMGVPTVTLRGDTMLSLQGVSMLSCAGLTDWIADDVAAYVALAVRHASQPQALAALRERLRTTVEQSPLFDTTRFTRDLEQALWRMCEEKIPTAESLRTQGNALLAQGRWVEAEIFFRHGLEYAPNDVSLRICLGYALQQQSRWADARGVLQPAAVPNAPDAFDAFYLLGEISEAENQKEDAKQHYVSALACKPDFEPARQAIERISTSNGGTP